MSLVEEFAPDFPDDELILYRNRALGVECLIAVPRASIDAAIKKNLHPPLWRHGEVMDVGAPREEMSGQSQYAQGSAGR